MQTQTIIGLMAQTSVHAGTGQTTGVIDLPIQREGHNGWPCVFGSGVKGALRQHAENIWGNGSDEAIQVFGPPPKANESSSSSDHAGALRVSDARLLLFPVRSLTSQFKWVTCPAALRRFKLDMQRFGYTTNFDIPVLAGKDKALIHTGEADQPLFLEEYRFITDPKDLSAFITPLESLIAQEGIKELLQHQLVIVSDDNFSHLVQHATSVNTHIMIDNETKTVARGALWTEETLPPETLLYVGLDAVASRIAKTEKMTASDIFETMTLLFKKDTGNPWLQLGGNETVGMGWCNISFLPQTDNKEG